MLSYRKRNLLLLSCAIIPGSSFSFSLPFSRVYYFSFPICLQLYTHTTERKAHPRLNHHHALYLSFFHSNWAALNSLYVFPKTIIRFLNNAPTNTPIPLPRPRPAPHLRLVLRPNPDQLLALRPRRQQQARESLQRRPESVIVGEGGAEE